MIEIEWKYLNKVLNELGVEITTTYRRELEQAKKNASHQLSNSFATFVKTEGENMTLYASLPYYWKYLEFGTRSAIGHPKGKFPPVSAIEEWIKVKPVVPFKMKNGKLPTTRQLAFLIARAIQERGTRPFYFLTKAIPSNNEIQRKINASVTADVEDWIYKMINYEINKDLIAK